MFAGAVDPAFGGGLHIALCVAQSRTRSGLGQHVKLSHDSFVRALVTVRCFQ